MPIALLTQSQPTLESHLPPAAIAPLAPAPRKKRNNDLESLLKTPRHVSVPVAAARSASPEQEAAAFAPLEAPGIFKGLLVAMMFNGGAVMLALLGYEAWSLLKQ